VKHKYEFIPLSLVEQIRETLVQSILSGRYREGEQITEVALQNEFGVSRSPIREALREVEKIGLLEIIPRKGAFVKQLTREDIELSFPIRAVLEGLAAGKASGRLKKEDLLRMVKALKKMEEAGGKRVVKMFMKQHDIFHGTFIKASGNRVLIDLLEKIELQSILFRFSHKFALFFEFQPDYFEISIQIHNEIFDLFSNENSSEKDIEWAVRKHIENSVDSVMAFMEKMSEIEETGETVSKA